MKVIGVDIGGTKIEIGLVDEGQVIESFTARTPADQSMEEVVQFIENEIRKIDRDDVAGIGIGVPGLVDSDSRLVLDVVNIPSWKQVPLQALMENRFRKPVFVNNDSNCFALGEKHFGKGRQYRNFAAITLGTGLGAGIIINHQLYEGTFCGAGEFGAIPYRDKTLEDFASGQFFIHKNLAGEKEAEKAMNGDQAALTLFDELGIHLGYALAYVALALSPEAIILGGSVTRSWVLFEKSMRKTLSKHLPYTRLFQKLMIHQSDLQKSSLIGAASLVWNSE